MARERRDRQPTVADERREAPARVRVGEKLARVAVRAPGARHDLDRLAAGGDGGVEGLLERAVRIEREEEADLHTARTSSTRTGRRSSVERARAKMTREAAEVVGGRALRLLTGADRAAELGEDAEPVDRPQRGQRDAGGALAVAAEPDGSPQGVVDASDPGGAAPGADELPVAVPRRLEVWLGPRALVGDGRAVVERHERRHRGVMGEGAVGRAPARARRPRPPRGP